MLGQGVGTDALGAVNLVWPFVMVLNAIVMLTVVGGVTVSAVRIGRGDITGANQAFMHSLAGTLTVAVVMMLVGTCLTSEIATLLGANRRITGSYATTCFGIRFSPCRQA
ncbi:MAG: MATE family efflux transporter [Oscillospiraceae bacterium]